MEHRSIIVFVLCSVVFLCEFCVVYSENENQSAENACSFEEDSEETQNGICTLAKNCRQISQNINATCSYDDGDEPVVCCHAKLNAVQKCEQYIRAGKRKKQGLVTIQVVGGTKTSKGEFPHMAAIGWSENREEPVYPCGGSLISTMFVLTAAHCRYFDSVEADTVRLGDDPSLYIISSIKQFTSHPDYSIKSSYNDIALVRLNKKIKFNRNIRPACLWNNEEVDPSSTLIVTGWGSISYLGPTSEHLLKADLSIVDPETCRNFYGEKKRYKNGIIDSQMCAGDSSGEKDTCQGDSGGPLQLKDVRNSIYHIVGITSFGKTCAGINSPAVYTKVYSFVPWIDSIVWPSL